MTRTLFVMSVLLAVGLLALPVRAQDAASAEEIPAAGPDLRKEVLHTVREGEFLHMMASYYYGNSRLWTKIYDDNKSVIKNPNIIRPGMVLRIHVAADWTAPMPYDQWYALAKEGAKGGTIDLVAAEQEPAEEEVKEESDPGARMSVMGDTSGGEDGAEGEEEETFE